MCLIINWANIETAVSDMLSSEPTNQHSWSEIVESNNIGFWIIKKKAIKDRV